MSDDSSNSEPVGGIFDKVQLTKLLIHTLREMGYANAAVTLQEESGGVQVESTAVQMLFRHIMQGQFDKVTFDLLQGLSLRLVSSEYASCGSQVSAPSSTGTSAPEINARETMESMEAQFEWFAKYYSNTQFNTKTLNKFRNTLEIMVLINMHFFAELIFVSGDLQTAVVFLRGTMRKYLDLWDAVLGNLQTHMMRDEVAFTPDKVLRELSALLTIPASGNTSTTPYPHLWNGSASSSKEELIARISFYINPNDLVPHGRLIELLRQAVKFQRAGNCSSLFDSELDTDFGPGNLVNLLQDNISDYERINFIEQKAFTISLDEVWYVQFSPDGKYLAVAVANSVTDRKVFIYDVLDNFSVYKVLKGNSQCVLYLSFSDDSRYLVTCPFNDTTNIYDIHASGEHIDLDPTTNVPNTKENNIRDPDKDEVELNVRSTELIGPIDSFIIPAGDIHSRPVETTPENSNDADSDDATAPRGNAGVYPGIEPTDLPGQPPQTSAAHDGTSHRSWCTDWFHTPKHKGKLVIGSPDREVVIYDTETRAIIYSFTRNKPKSRSNSSGYSSSEENEEETERPIPVWSHGLSTVEILNEEFPRVHDVKISHDDNYLLVMTHQGTIDVVDISALPSNEEITRSENACISHFRFKFISRMRLGCNITCISLPQPNTRDAQGVNTLVLVNLQHNEMQLWDFKENYLIQKFLGQTQRKFIIRSCFGYNNKLVACGSEDGKVYIWDRVKGNVVGVLNGHNITLPPKGQLNARRAYKNCNMIAWNPENQNMFVSGGDDGLVKVWRVVKD